MEMKCVRVDGGSQVHNEPYDLIAHSDPLCITCSTDTDCCRTYSKCGFVGTQLQEFPVDSHAFTCELDLW